MKLLSRPRRPRRTGEWTDAKNARRFALIDREVDGTISPEESSELDALQTEFRRYRRRVAPLPVGETRQLLERLERVAGQLTAAMLNPGATASEV